MSLDIKKEWLADALAGGHEPDFYTPASKEKTMTVRAKFKVESVTQTTSGASIKLQPVSSGSAENEKFFKWTPWGAIEIGTVNPEAAAQFQPGQAFYVDFTPAE